MKSAYYIALNVINPAGCVECSHGESRIPLWKRIWQLKIPPKIRIFTWKACVNALPTMLNLKKRGGKHRRNVPFVWKGRRINPPLCDVVKEVWNQWKDCPFVIGAENLDFADTALRLLHAETIRDL